MTKLKENKIVDPTKAKAAIAYLISEGWGIDLHGIAKTIPGGLTDSDWLEMANGCMAHVMNELAKDKVIPLAKFQRN